MRRESSNVREFVAGGHRRAQSTFRLARSCRLVDDHSAGSCPRPFLLASILFVHPRATVTVLVLAAASSNQGYSHVWNRRLYR